MTGTAELGNVATRLLFENERVRVWEMLLEPGESSDLHRHGLFRELLVELKDGERAR